MLQLDLIARAANEELHPYWREQLKDWPREVFAWRHHRDSTGWSVATQGFLFARLLFRDGQMTRAEFRRWWKLDRRVQRWENNYYAALS